MDLLRNGADWLARTQARHASQEVVYCRGSSSATVRATIGRTDFEHQDEQGGFLTRVQSRDFLILTHELRLDGVAVEPQSGDRIIEGGLTDGRIYEVSDMPGSPCWRWADDYRQRRRVHTKFIGRQDASDTSE